MVRVNRGGNPISFLTDLNLDLSSKVCKLCNSQLHFEVQILPHSIHYMTNDDTSGDSVTTKLKNISLRLGGVLFYTCKFPAFINLLGSSDCNTSTNLSQELSHVLLYN